MIKKYFSRKFFLKIFSLMASLFIWMYVVSSAEIEITKLVPVKIELPDGMSIKNEMTKEVTFRFRGPGLFVRKYLEKDLTIDVKKNRFYKKGITKYNIRLEQFKFKLPIGVELMSMEPRILQLNLERTREKLVKVKPVFSQKILDQYNIKEIKVFPDKIKISGPRSLVKGINIVETKTIEDLKSNDTSSFFVTIPRTDSRILLHEKAVEISYTLQSKNIEFTFTQVPIIFQSVKLIKNVNPKLITVKVFGDESKIKKLNKDSIQVIGYVPKDAANQVEIELTTELPDGIKALELSPKKVTVDLE
jgi:YbbR domain-containing protein